MAYAFDDADAPNRKERQYYEMFGNRAIWVDGWKAVTLHANRMPWDAGRRRCRSMRTNGSSTTWPRISPRARIWPNQNPGETRRVDRNVRRRSLEVQRLSALRRHDRAIGPSSRIVCSATRTEFVYFAPGRRTRIAEKSSAPVKNRAHTIETTLDLQGGEEGCHRRGRRHDRRLTRCSSRTTACTTTTTTWTVCTTYLESPPLPEGATEREVQASSRRRSSAASASCTSTERRSTRSRCR